MSIIIHPGNYYLGYDTINNRLVRLGVSHYIPEGCIRIKHMRYKLIYIDPFIPMLSPEFWALPRYGHFGG